MKLLFNIVLFALSLSITAQEPESSSIMNNDENTFLSGFVDPTFTDRGAQYGISLTKEVLWGYIETSASVYPELQPTYFDLVFSGGLAIEKNRFTFHTGPRAGMELRGGGPFLMLGYQARLLFQITEHIYIGGKLWIDYRYSQDSQFYGNGDMLRENGAFYVAIKLN